MEEEKKGREQKETGPARVKVLPMKTLEVLVIGAAGSGKSTLAQGLIDEQKEVNDQDGHPYSEVGMSLKKAEIPLASGETVRLCVWDPKISMLPKEKVSATKDSEQIKSNVKREKKTPGAATAEQSYVSQLLEGDLFSYRSSSAEEDDGASSTESEIANHSSDKPLEQEAPKDTNGDLALKYLKNGTYHTVVFVFDSLDINTENESGLDSLRQWYETFRKLCFKSSHHASLAFVANHRSQQLTQEQKIQDLIQRECEPDQNNLIENNKTEEEISQFLDQVAKELQINPYSQQNEGDQAMAYFEVNALEGKGISSLKKWVIDQSLQRYSDIEAHRFDPYPKPEKNRLCGFADFKGCLIV